MTTISSKVKMLLEYYGKKQIDLMECLSMSSRQSLNNKIALDRWSGQDLTKVAEFLGCRIGFMLPDGTTIYLDQQESKKGEEPGDD